MFEIVVKQESRPISNKSENNESTMIGVSSAAWLIGGRKTNFDFHQNILLRQSHDGPESSAWELSKKNPPVRILALRAEVIDM